MKLNLKSFLALAVLLSLLTGMRGVSQASDLTVIAPSNVSLGISIGFFLDDDNNLNNPDTGNPYAPGDHDPNSGNPVTFASIGNGVGQGDPSVPLGTFPGGVVPLTGTGLSTTLNGTVSVNASPPTPNGIAINSGAVGLNVSGLWQPGTVSPTDANGPPALGELGAYIDANAVIPGEYVVATLNGTIISLHSAAVPLTGNAFDDPAATVTLVTSVINGFAAGPLASALSTTVTNVVTSVELSGTFDQVGMVGTLTLPFSAVSYTSVSDQLPGLYAQISQNGLIVATGLVPEPGSMALMFGGLVGFCSYFGVRRRRNRSAS